MPFIPNSFIKSVALPVNRRYKLTSSPFSAGERKDGQSEEFYIGRNQHRAKFLRFLNDDQRNGGVFLITGFRGVGKTSFVNQTLRDYKNGVFKGELKCKKGKECKGCKHCKDSRKRKAQVIDIHLTLAQNSPKESDILRLIVASVFDAYKKYAEKYDRLLLRLHNFNQWLYRITMVLIIGALPALAELASKSGQLQFKGHWYLIIISSFALGMSIAYLISGIMLYKAGRKDSPMNRISNLFERCYNTLAVESTVSSETSVPLLNVRLFSGGERRTKQFPVASNKEIEYELERFLALACGEGLEFIFVFDELDKVEPFLSGQDLYADLDAFEKEKRENAYERNARDRRQAIISIIAGLKNFFTTANARFIFIAGNEMFDASLADVSDRQSSISSIFTYVFNIESLLKEKDLFQQVNTANSLSMSDAIELYLKKVLFEDESNHPGKSSLYDLVKDSIEYEFEDKNGKIQRGVNEAYFAKVYFVLQHFITYLTYRSNGSPKKLIREIHEFIRVGDNLDTAQTIIGLRPIKPKGSDEFKPPLAETDNKEPLFLYFNYYNQYRINFISYLYRPFLIRHGRSLKLYSDNLIVSTPFLFDHLIKFHPFAFSLSNLEQVPEVLSSNKTPLLRQHLRKIIDYLGASHIKEIEIGLFDYRFRSRTLNEIAYLSRISEQEAAALNYTLDESYLVKLHVRNKIKDLRDTYANFLNGHDQSTHIFSIAHLNGTLGDLYFYDQQYDDAIVAYSDAIRPINSLEISKMSMQDFTMLMRNRLKVGLCFEKISSYEDALAHYANCSTDASRFMLYRFAKEHHIRIFRPASDLTGQQPDEETVPPQQLLLDQDKYQQALTSIDTDVYHSASLSDLLQLVLQTFLAQLYIQEKKSVAGVSEIKIFIAFGSFMKITEGFITDKLRNKIIKANAYLHVGHLFYFRNSERDIKFNNEVKAILPAFVYDDLKALIEKYDEQLKPNEQLKTKEQLKPKETRPVFSLYFYILGLMETFRYRGAEYEENMVTINKLQEKTCSNYIKSIIGRRNIIFGIIRHLEKNHHLLSPTRGIHYHNLAVLLSNIGDDLLCRFPAGKNEDYRSFKISQIFIPSAIEKVDQADSEFRKTLVAPDYDKVQLADILRCYHFSAYYYEREGRFADAAFQHCKILYVLRMVINEDENQKLARKFCQSLEKTLIQPALKLVSQINGHTDRHMLGKAVNFQIPEPIAINNLSGHPDSREIILLFAYLKIKLKVEIRPKKELYPFEHLISPVNSLATQHGRVLELATMAKYLEKKVKSAAKKLRLSNEVSTAAIENDFIEYLFARLSALQILDILGSDYWLGYSYLAYTHFHTAEVLKELKGLAIVVTVEKQLKTYLGAGSYASLDYRYHYSKAKHYYQQAIQLHTAGAAYRSMVDELIYLEDDFNDNIYHFGAALDRYLMNNAVFVGRIRKCNEELSDDNDFLAERYID